MVQGESAHDLIDVYTKEYYLMDCFYRKFYFYYDKIADKDLFGKLAERVENTYTHWYLNELSIKWSAAVQEEMLEDYSLAGIKQQKDFYRDFVSPFIRNEERVFVIISDRITYLEFFQTELVEDKRTPLKLKLYFEDKEGNRISNENIIIADSRSKNPEDRTYREKFTLRDMAYDKNKEYYLILEDEDETVEKIYERIPFMIDLLFSFHGFCR